MLKSKTKLLFSVLFVFIISITIFRLYNPPLSKYKNETEIEGKIVNIKKGTCTQLEVDAKEKVLVYDCNDKKYEYGIGIKVEGKLQVPKESSTFNYKNYLLSKNIHKIMYADNVEIISKEVNIFYEVKNKITEKTENYKSEKYLNAFVLGKTDLIEEDVLNSYRSNGISHLFAISGMHITLLSTILFFLLSKFFSKKIVIIIISLFLLFYMFITNFTPSVIRAVLMFILLNFSFKNKLFVLVFLFLAMLLINPFYLYNIGFCFSYSVTFFLIYFKDLINKKFIINTFVISIIAFLASLPILIKSFNSVNFLIPIWNVFFVPLVTTFIYPFSLLTYFFSFLDNPFFKIMNVFEGISLWIEKIDFLTFSFKEINLLGVFLYFLIVFLVLKNKKYILIFLIIIILHININYFEKNAYLTVLDVGQGDCILFSLPNNKGNILIDTGGNINSDVAQNKVIPYLKSVGISKIDYLILTHGDYDHMGASIDLVNGFKVDKVIFNNDDFNDLELELIELLEEKNIKYYQNMEKLNVDNTKLYFLNDKIYDNENDNSNVIYTEFNEIKLLLMGDASAEVEKDIIENYNLEDIDILKVGHHGSKTSSCEDFIDSINPKYSVISVGKNNRYGHPNDEVLDNLEDSKIYRTDIDGDIIFKIKNNKLEIGTYVS